MRTFTQSILLSETCLLLCVCTYTSHARINQGKPQPPTRPEEIVEYVLPQGDLNAIKKRLAQYPRAKLIRVLTTAQREAREPRAQGIAYLLAVLHHDYAANRRRLIKAMRGCNHRPLTMACDEDTAWLLIDLYERGDCTVLDPLLDAGAHSDAALSEMLGTFYGEVLEKHPRAFLRALAPRAAKEQRELAWLAGGLDGGGMADSELREVRSKLRQIGRRRHDQLGTVARRCLVEVEAVNAEVRHPTERKN